MISQARHTRWIHRYHEIQRLRGQHLGIAAIARQVQVSRPTVYRYLAMPQPPERQRSRHRGPLLITPFIPYLRQRWNAGCRNAQQLWRELVAQGHRPSRMTVERYVGQLRRETGTWPNPNTHDTNRKVIILQVGWGPVTNKVPSVMKTVTSINSIG
jgi:transposase